MSSSKIIVFILLLCCLFACSKETQNQEHKSLSVKYDKDTVSIHKSKHVLITEESTKDLGFIPDRATEYKVNKENSEVINIEGDKINFIKLNKKEAYFNMKYIVDSTKKTSTQYRLYIYHDGEFLNFNKNKFLEFTMPRDSSISIPLKVSSPNVDFSEYLLILSEKDEDNSVNEFIPVSKMLVTKEELKNLPKNTSVRLLNNSNIYTEKTSTNDFGVPTITTLDASKEPIKENYQKKKAKYIKVDQSPVDITEELFFFDEEGNILNKRYITKQSHNKDILIPIPKQEDNKKIFFLINNNPQDLAFRNIKELTKNVNEPYLSFSYFYEVKN